MEGWDTNDGAIISAPLAGYKVVPVAGMALLVRLEYFQTPQAMQSGQASAVQLMMTPAQAEELCQALSRTADRVLQVPNDGTAQN